MNFYKTPISPLERMSPETVWLISLVGNNWIILDLPASESRYSGFLSTATNSSAEVYEHNLLTMFFSLKLSYRYT
jgi:hypothetical protein